MDEETEAAVAAAEARAREERQRLRDSVKGALAKAASPLLNKRS